jgi:hypothetical protein
MFLAERAPQAAVALARRNFAHTQGNARRWLSLGLGVALLRWDRFADAATQLAQAQAQFAIAADDPAELIARHWQLTVECWLPTTADLLERLETLAAECVAAGFELEAARLRFEQIARYNIRGQYATARDLATALQPLISRVGTTADKARLKRLQAVTSLGDGRFEDVWRTIRAAEELYYQAGYQVEVLKTRCEYARLHQYREEYSAALPLYRQYLQQFRRLDLPFWQAMCAKHLAVSAEALGLADTTVTYSLEARRIFEAYQRPEYAVECDLNIVNVAYRNGLYDLADITYRRAEATYAASGWERMVLASKLNQALVLRSRNEPAAGLALINAIAAMARNRQYQRELAEITYMQGLLLADLDQPVAADRHFEQAIQHFHTLGNAAGMAKCRLEQGWLALKQPDVLRAGSLFRQAHDVLYERKPHRWRVEYGLARCAELGDDSQTALRLYRRAVMTVAQMRHHLANAHASSGLYAQAQRLFADALHLAVRLQDRAGILELAEQQRRLAWAGRDQQAVRRLPADLQSRLDAQCRRLQQLLDEAAPEAAIDAGLHEYIALLLQREHRRPRSSAVVPPTPDVAALRTHFDAAYPDGWSVLMYVPYGDDILLVALSSTGFTTHIIAVDAAFQAALARTTRPVYREYTYLDLAYRNGANPEAWADLNMLGARLIPRSIRPALESDRRLIVVPCGMLHALPWPALRIENQWLIERAIIQQTASLRCWIDLQNRPAPGSRALILGIHQFQQPAPELPDSTATTSILQRHWHGPIASYHNAAVNRETLLSQAAEGQLRDYGLLHLSTHGHLIETHGLLAHLKLYDSDLCYDDVTRLNLGPALVVLVTCDGARCEVLPGEEVLSIGNGFLQAGARDVVASLWQLYAAVVPVFLEPFYAALSRGSDAPTALAAAQRALLARNTGDPLEDAVFRAPLAWAGMCACGAGTTTVNSKLFAAAEPGTPIING